MISINKITDSLSPVLRNMSKALSQGGKTILLRRMGNRFLQLTKSTFGTNGQFRGNTWPRLSKQYAKKVGGSASTLLRSGELKDSIRVGAPRGNWIEIYTNNKYAASQFLGSKSKGLPSRRFMPIEMSGTNLFRLTPNGQREMMMEFSKGLTQLSLGAFPRVFNITSRMPFERGNPRTGPS